jgi:hypothetical protein
MNVFAIRFLVQPTNTRWARVTKELRQRDSSDYRAVTNPTPEKFRPLLKTRLVTAAPVLLSVMQHGAHYHDGWWQNHVTRSVTACRRITLIFTDDPKKRKGAFPPSLVTLMADQTFGVLFIDRDETRREFPADTTVITFDGPTIKKAVCDVSLNAQGEFDVLPIAPPVHV